MTTVFFSSAHFTFCLSSPTGLVDMMHTLITNGSVVNAADFLGSTPLHFASQRGRQSALVRSSHVVVLFPFSSFRFRYCSWRTGPTSTSLTILATRLFISAAQTATMRSEFNRLRVVSGRLSLFFFSVSSRSFSIVIRRWTSMRRTTTATRRCTTQRNGATVGLKTKTKS